MTVAETIDRPAYQERELPEKTQDVVRVITLHMASAESSRFLMMNPPMIDIEPTGEWFDLDIMPQVTTMIWEQKAGIGKSENPNQLLLPGGKIDEQTINEKTVKKAGRRELWEELHLKASDLISLSHLDHAYSFVHSKLINRKKPGILHNRVHMVSTIVSPHDHARYFDPSDKLAATLSLRPNQVTELLETNQVAGPDGTVGYLLDSLSTNMYQRQKAQVRTDGKEHIVKDAIETHAYVFEATTQREVIVRLLNSTEADVFELSYNKYEILRTMETPTTVKEAQEMMQLIHVIVHEIEMKYEPSAVQQVVIPPEASITTLMEHGITEDQIKRRVLLASEISEAIKEVAFDETVRISAATGPQQPYIVAQAFTELSRPTNYEFGALAQVPEMRHIVATACNVFDINPRLDVWHDQLMEHLREFRKLRSSSLREDRIKYKIFHDRFATLFCTPLDPDHVSPIRDTRHLGRLSKLANDFLSFLREPLASIADPNTLNALMPDPNGVKTSEISELFFRAFGVSQYKDEAITRSEQYAATRKLLLMLTIHKVETIWEKETNLHIFPFRNAFNTLFGEMVDTVRVGDTFAYSRYRLDPMVFTEYPTLAHYEDSSAFGIDFKEFPLWVISDIREKDILSLIRKYIERGGTESEDEELSDFFGVMITLDDEQFKKDFTQKMPYTTLSGESMEQVTAAWKRWAAKVVLLGLQEALIKDRASNNPTFRMYKGRESATMKGIVPIEGQKAGSAASVSDDDKWEWIKYVFEMTDSTLEEYQEEIQFFPSFADLALKKVDDKRFWQARSFAPTQDRYPLASVFFGVQDVYEEVARKYILSKLKEIEKQPWYRRISSYIWHYIQQSRRNGIN
jgi:8-oxo-dGTP pyrophosphatase MutT (NUDIX family)